MLVLYRYHSYYPSLLYYISYISELYLLVLYLLVIYIKVTLYYLSYHYIKSSIIS